MRDEGLSEEQKQEKRQQHAIKETEFLRLKRSRLGVDDFTPLKVIGRGAFGEGKQQHCLTLNTIDLSANSTSVFPRNDSSLGAEERHWTRVCDEDLAQGRHGREGAGGTCSRRTRHPGGGGPSVGGEDVLLVPRLHQSLSHHGGESTLFSISVSLSSLC